jgi:hypothetical protein
MQYGSKMEGSVDLGNTWQLRVRVIHANLGLTAVHANEWGERHCCDVLEGVVEVHEEEPSTHDENSL